MSGSSGAYAGIYAQSGFLISTLNSLPDYVYTTPQVTGVSLKLVWGTIEPQPGVFDWSTLDAEVSRAVAYGKKISLAVVPDLSVPSWLFQEGVPDLRFTIQDHGPAQTIDIAPPWDPTYQQAYAQMMQALAAHLRSIPGAYQAVSMVKITGMDAITEETRLPNAMSSVGGVTNTIPIWQQVGYTPTKAINAWKGFAASVNAAFPDKVLVAAIAGGFPLINEQGQQVAATDPSYVNVTDQILAAGVSLYGGRFAANWTGLNSSNLNPTILAAEQAGAIGGWQTNDYLGPQGTGYGSDWTQKIALTNSTYQQILDLGINQGAGQYIEVWPTDIQQFPGAIAEAAARIASLVTVAQGGTVEIPGSGNANVVFAGSTGTLILDQSSAFSGWISGLRGNDQIDLKDIAYGSQTTLSYTANATNPGGTVVVSDGQHTANISLVGNFSAGDLLLTGDSGGGTSVGAFEVVPTSANMPASHYQVFAVSSLFTTTGPAIVEYDLWDTGGGGAHFVLNGQALPANQNNYLSASQVAQTTYQSGLGADSLRVRVSNGSQWTTWSGQFTVTGPIDPGPVATATSARVSTLAYQSLAVSNLFTATDPFGDTITSYDLWNSGSGGGHFVLNGQALGANQDNYVSPAQLAQLVYQSGSAADTLWVRAGDGTEWGAWSNAFTVVGTVDTGPVATPTSRNVSAGHDQSLAAASLFTASDPFGISVTAFDLWNSGTGGGYFALNGQALAMNHDNYLSPAQLAQATYQSGSGPDTLWVRASDGIAWGSWCQGFTVTAPVDPGPVARPASQNVSAVHNQSFAASSLFTANDPFGDAITTYDLWDSGAGGGHLVLNGQALAVSQDNYLSAAQLAQTTYQSGSGPDMLWVRAGDGTQWGAWSPGFMVTAPVDTGPVASPVSQNVTAAHNQSFAASSLFTASDPFGDAITTYDLWDSGTGGGHIVLNGQALAVNHDNLLSAAQLAETVYQSGSGADTLWVRASDGSQWSSWSNALTVTAPADTGPTATGANISTVLNQSFTASVLFTASDPFGDAITTYDLWNLGTGGGHFVLNGQALPMNQDNFLSAAQLAQASYESGSAADTVWVRANEGGQRGPWSQGFVVTGASSASIAANAKLELASSFSGTVSFSAATGTLKIDQSSTFGGTIAGQLAGNDIIDLADITAGTSATVGYTGNNSPGTLTVTDGTHSATLALLGQYSAAGFAVAGDGSGGTLITYSISSEQQNAVAQSSQP
jgi:hypothetical protein